jgi:hypothetical protein
MVWPRLDLIAMRFSAQVPEARLVSGLGGHRHASRPTQLGK